MICYQSSTSKHTDRHVFTAVEGKKNSLPESVLSIRAGSQPKQPATGQSLAGYLRLTLLLILVRNLTSGKDPTKIIVRYPPQMSESK